MTGQWHGGKGSRPRSFSVDQETFANNWERVFGKKEKKKSDQEIIEEVSKLIAEETLTETEDKKDDTSS